MNPSPRLVFAASLLTLCTTAFCQITYTRTDLSTLVPGLAGARLNNAGHLALGARTLAGQQAYFYADGTLSQIPETDGLRNLSVHGLNDHDEIVGIGTHADGSRGVFYYNARTSVFEVRDYEIGEGYEAILGFNNLGQVAIGTYSGGAHIRRIYDGESVYTPPTSGGNAIGLNNDGELLVDLYSGAPRLWNPRTDTFSEPLNIHVSSYVIGDNGWVAGTTPHRLMIGQVDDTLPASASDVGGWRGRMRVGAVNRHGTVVGSLEDASSTPWHAFVSFGGPPVDLNSLTEGLPTALMLVAASQINDAGQIIASVGREGGGYSGVYLLNPTGPKPVPEPGVIGLAGAVLLGGAILLRRKRRSLIGRPMRAHGV